MKKQLLLGLIALAVLLAPVQAQKVGERDKEAFDSITVAEIIDHIYFLASDELTGRSPGTSGYQMAAKYSATQFHAAGALPIIMDEEGNPTYYQNIPMKRVFKSPETSMVIGESEFKHGLDFAAVSAGKETSLEASDVGLVFVGYGITAKKAGYDDYEGLDVEGKYVVMMAGAPMKDGEPVLPPEIHKHYEDVQQSIMPKFLNVKQHKAAGIIIVPPTEETLPGDFKWDSVIGMMAQDRISMDSDKPAMNPMGFLDIPFLLVTEAVVNDLFADAPYNPATGEGKYTTFELDEALDITIETKEEKFKTANVVAIVPGTDPELQHEYITIGAHLDHTGQSPMGINNGADDNASGSTAVLEVAEAVAKNPTRRSVAFILYTAEESGLHGSRYFVNNPPFEMEQVVVNLNLDMVGRETDDAPGGVSVIGSKMRSQELKDIIIKVNEEKTRMVLDFSTDEEDPQNLAGRSDHFNFHLKGVPVAFFSTGLHSEYHTPEDDPGLIVPEKIQSVSQLCYGVTQYLGNRDERLKID
jgi:hypothetical protein